MLTLLKRPRTPDSRPPQVAHLPPCFEAEADAIRRSPGPAVQTHGRGEKRRMPNGAADAGNAG